MHISSQIIHGLFPIVALILMFIGIKRQAIYYIISALWISIIALIINFQYSEGQILGSYFNYTNATIYTTNLLILMVSVFLIINHLLVNTTVYRYLSSLFKAFVLIGCMMVLINLWTNAHFIENRMPGTPVMQVTLLNKTQYCSYKYVFYKVNTDGSVLYLCPNHYGLIPSIGKLLVSPDFITTQLSRPIKKQMLLLQQKES